MSDILLVWLSWETKRGSREETKIEARLSVNVGAVKRGEGERGFDGMQFQHLLSLKLV